MLLSYTTNKHCTCTTLSITYAWTSCYATTYPIAKEKAQYTYTLSSMFPRLTPQHVFTFAAKNSSSGCCKGLSSMWDSENIPRKIDKGMYPLMWWTIFLRHTAQVDQKPQKNCYTILQSILDIIHSIIQIKMKKSTHRHTIHSRLFPTCIKIFNNNSSEYRKTTKHWHDPNLCN